MKGRWEVETEPYLPRISRALDVFSGALKATEKLPVAPFSTELTPEQYVAFTLATFARSGAVVIDQLIDNVGLLWSQGRMVGVSSLVRFALEYWAAIHFGKRIAEVYLADKNLEEATRKTARLAFSAKTPVKLPWGGLTENQSHSVQTFIELLGKKWPSALDDYNFLSEASHPNFLQNSYFMMASRVYDNYSNESFKSHAHELLEKTILAIEHVADGATNDIKGLLDQVLPMCPR